MIGIDLICVGKLKEKFFAEAVKEYEKRLSAYCKLNITEISENVVSSQSEIAPALSKEGEKILAKMGNAMNEGMIAPYQKLFDKMGQKPSADGKYRRTAQF